MQLHWYTACRAKRECSEKLVADVFAQSSLLLGGRGKNKSKCQLFATGLPNVQHHHHLGLKIYSFLGQVQWRAD